MPPDTYDDDFSNYTRISTTLKGHDKFDIWDNWSKKNTARCNYEKNMKLWNWRRPIYTINILVYILRTKFNKSINYVKNYKKYNPLTNNKPHKTFNDRFVSTGWTYDEFLQNDITIIKSTTGTGKTTATAQHLHQLLTKNTSNNILKQTMILNSSRLRPELACRRNINRASKILN